MKTSTTNFLSFSDLLTLFLNMLLDNLCAPNKPLIHGPSILVRVRALPSILVLGLVSGLGQGWLRFLEE